MHKSRYVVMNQNGGWQIRNVYRHPLGDEAIILMPDKNLRCMTALSVLFGQFYCCTKCLRFAWEN